MRVWSRPDAVDTVDYALEKGADILEYYGEYYGTAYPLEKMGRYQLKTKPNKQKTNKQTNKQTNKTKKH